MISCISKSQNDEMISKYIQSIYPSAKLVSVEPLDSVRFTLLETSELLNGIYKLKLYVMDKAGDAWAADSKRRTLTILDSVNIVFNRDIAILDSIHDTLTIMNIDPKYSPESENIKAARAIYYDEGKQYDMVLYLGEKEVSYSDIFLDNQFKEYSKVRRETLDAVLESLKDSIAIKNGTMSSRAWK